MIKIFNRVGSNTTAGIYFNDVSKEKIILVRVNRTYQQPKKPVYYLKLGNRGRQPQYLTGLFVTDNSHVFSGDTKDEITGMKTMLFVTFVNGGEVLHIEGENLWV
jgi:hypothetical protein